MRAVVAACAVGPPSCREYAGIRESGAICRQAFLILVGVRVDDRRRFPRSAEKIGRAADLWKMRTES